MKTWGLSVAFWAGIYFYVAGVSYQVAHDVSLSDPNVWVPGLLGIVGLSIWKAWTDV